MSTITIALPDALKEFVDGQAARCGYGDCAEYVGELIRRDEEALRLRSLLVAGSVSPATTPADALYFQNLRNRAPNPHPSEDRG